MTTKYTNQVAFRGRIGDTVGLNVDGGWATGTNINWNQEADTVFRVRFEYQEQNNKSNVMAAQLEINYSGTWANITTSSGPIIATGSAQFANDAATTNLLTLGAGTFVAGYGSHDGLTPNITLQNTHTEVEYSLSIDGLVVNNNDTIQLRVAGLDNWAFTPTITIIKAIIPPTILCNVGSITFSGQRASVPVSQTIACNSGSITFTGQAATVSVVGGAVGEVFHITHEDGTFSEYTSTVNETDMAINASAAMVGNYGLDITVDGSQADVYAWKAFTIGTNAIRFRFYFKRRTLSMLTGQRFIILLLSSDETWEAHTYVSYCEIQYDGSTYQIRIRIVDDISVSPTFNYSSPLGTDPHCVEILFTKESSDGAIDGTAYFWVDGGLVDSKTDWENWNIFPTIDGIEVGTSSGLDAGTSGTFSFDDIIVRDDDTFIGCVTGDVTISGSAGAMTFVGQPVSIVTDQTISCNSGNLSFVGQSATIVVDQTVPCQTGNLTFSGQTATIVVGATTISCNSGTLTFTGQSASILAGSVNVACNAGTITFSGQAATVVTTGAPQSISCQVGTLTFVGQAVTISVDQTIAVQTGQITFAGQAATILVGATTIACQAGTIAFAGQQATLVAGETTVACNTGTLTFAGQTVGVGGKTIISCTAGNLTFTGQTASIFVDLTIACGTGQLTFTGQSATIVTGAGVISCQAGTITFSGQSATIVGGAISIACQNGQITFSGQSATVAVGATVIACQNGTITFTGQSASIVTGAVTVSCASGNLTFAGQQAAIISLAEGVVGCQTGQITFSGQPATIVTGAISVACQTGSITFSGQSASIKGAYTVNASSGALTFAGQSASIISGAGVIGCQYGEMTFSGLSTTIVPGEVAPTLSYADLTFTGQTVTVTATIPGITITSSFGQITFSGQSVVVVPGAVTVTTDAGLMTFTGLSAALIGEVIYPKGYVTISDSLLYNVSMDDSSVNVVDDTSENVIATIEDL